MADQNVIATQLTMGLMSAGALQWLKSRAWLPFVNQHSAAFNHLFLVATSIGTGLGIHLVWSGSSHSLTITNLDFAAIAGAVWIWSKQWAMQFLVHRGVFGPVASPLATKGPTQ